MAVDIIARGLASRGGGGGSGDAYTKAETDALLNEKQNLINSQNKLSSDLIIFNISEEDLVRLYNEAKAETTTEYIVEGDTIKFLTDVSQTENSIKIETQSTFGYKDKVFL
jgi:hypothetical protein